MAGTDYDDYDVHPEEILNVLRRMDDDWLPTPDVASPVDNGRKRVQEQLFELKGEGRVKHREIGNAHVWRLAPDEVSTPIDPELAGAAKWARNLRNVGTATRQTGFYFFAGGGALALLSLTASLQNITLSVVTKTELLVLAYGTLAGGGAAILTGAFLVLAGLGAPILAKQVLAWRNQ